jgi:hypothetical protein
VREKDCGRSHSLEKSDIREESRATVGVLRAVEEALRALRNARTRRVFSAVEHSDQKHLWERHREQRLNHASLSSVLWSNTRHGMRGDK